MAESFCRPPGVTRLNHEVAPTLWTDRETGVLQSLLDIHALVDQVGNELRARQRLVRCSHDPEADVLRSMLHESRNDGVERPFARGGSFALDFYDPSGNFEFEMAGDVAAERVSGD